MGTRLEERIMMVIAERYTFTIKEIRTVFEKLDSIDETIYIIELASQLSTPLKELTDMRMNDIQEELKIKAHRLFYTDSPIKIDTTITSTGITNDKIKPNTKYRIKIVHPPGGKYFYDIEQCVIKKSWWFPHLNQTETWYGLDFKGSICIPDNNSPTPPPLNLFKSLEAAKKYLDVLKAGIEEPDKSRIVYETEF